MAESKIHPTALIDREAELDVDVEIGPYCVLGAGVKIGKGTRLISHVVLDGDTQLGQNNTVYPFSSIGAPPQDLSYAGEPTRVRIGNHNLFREGVSIHRGTANGRGETTLGDHNYLMAYTHVAHDGLLGNHIIMANQTSLAGHVEIQDHVIIGGLSGVQQRARIGAYSFLGGATAMRRDLPPFMAAKEFSEVSGPNLVGLRRKGVSDVNTRVIAELYKIFYLGNLTLEKALQEIESRYPDNEYAKQFITFVRGSKIGVQR